MKFFKDVEIRKKLFIGVNLILLYFILYNINFLWSVLGKLVEVLIPFIVGSAIAFVLNVPMRWVESKLFKNNENSKWKGLQRAISIVITIVLAIVILALILYMVIPQLAETLAQLIMQIPNGVKQLTKWAEKFFKDNPVIMEMVGDLAEDWQSILEEVFGVIKGYVNSVLESGINVISGIVSGLLNFIIGFVFSLYVLAQKEKLTTNAKKIVYALFDKSAANEMVIVAKLTEKTFANFISGQCAEAIILASMFVVSMTILKLPYAMLVGILIGATSLIPIVGAFIGCVVGALLILMVDPVKALIFVITFLVIQQIEGNLIYPKVVGNSVGLPGIWVLVSVTVGGSLFGIMGMVIFIPLVSVCYSLFRRLVYRMLGDKNLLDGHELVVEDIKELDEEVEETLEEELGEINENAIDAESDGDGDSEGREIESGDADDSKKEDNVDSESEDKNDEAGDSEDGDNESKETEQESNKRSSRKNRKRSRRK